MAALAKKCIAIFVSLALVLSVTAVIAAFPDTSHAATKPYMKSLKLKWDLKKNKTLNVSQALSGLGNKKVAVKMTDFKITKASEDNFKKLSFKVTFTRKYSLTKTQVHKCVNSKVFKQHREVGGSQYFTIVDYKTGKSLESSNDAGVTVISSWSFKGNKKVTDKDGCWVRLPKTSIAKITIVYPNDYKNLCIGVGGYNLPYLTSADSFYWNGQKAFGKTSFYKKGKSNSHWMLVK